MSYLRTIIRKAGTIIGGRRSINFIEGSNVTLTVTDNSGTDSVDVTITAAGGSGSPGGASGEIQYNNAGAFGGLDTATYPSITELSYVKGVTSAIQTQLNNKQDSGSYAYQSTTLTINGVTYDLSADRSWTVTPAEPNIPLTLKAPLTSSEVITDGYSAYVSEFYEIADTYYLEIGDGSTFEIG